MHADINMASKLALLRLLPTAASSLNLQSLPAQLMPGICLQMRVGQFGLSPTLPGLLKHLKSLLRYLREFGHVRSKRVVLTCKACLLYGHKHVLTMSIACRSAQHSPEEAHILHSQVLQVSLLMLSVAHRAIPQVGFRFRCGVWHVNLEP